MSARWPVVLVAVGVLGAQWSMTVKWGEPINGVVFLVYEAALLLALLLGVALERFTRRPLPDVDRTADADGDGDGDDGSRPNRALLAVAAVGLVVFGGLCARFAFTDMTWTPPGDGIVPTASCGSPIDPVDYDCRRQGRTAVYLTGTAALVCGGWTVSALRRRRLRVPPVAVAAVVVTGVALLVAAVVVMPGSYPSPTAAGAPGGYGDDFQNWAFAQVLGDLHTAGWLIVAAAAVLAPLAVSRHGRGVLVPVPAALVGVVVTGLAGVVVMANVLVPMLSYFMAGP